MSEEILDALMQLFAIIAKQDEGVEASEVEYVRNFLVSQLPNEKVVEYMDVFTEKAGGENKSGEKQEAGEKKLTSVKDSVRILGLCKKINKKLSQPQKVVVLVRLFELVNADRNFSDQRMAIINTVAEVFKLPSEEFQLIKDFVVETKSESLDFPQILIVSDTKPSNAKSKFVKTDKIDDKITILSVASSDLYFLKYSGNETILLNGLVLNNKRIYLFAPGSTIKLPKGKPIYYSDVVAHYMADSDMPKISFSVENLNYTFPTGGIGLRDINIYEEQGKLVGIMGASGAGKTTLMNALSGITCPTDGKVLINGIDLHKEKEDLGGIIGYIPQDDLLIEELTVFQNLFYSAKLCFKGKSDNEIEQLVNKTLKNLGLFERKDLKVGSPLNKMISGGQRKRLNIALELIREPSILFVDEPTSGLSSRDSENVMDLLRELTLKGKLIFVVIHQPSSDIYKMFDKMVILDTGGFLIYYGNPIEAITHFKQADNQINSDIGECPVCGSINPESIFNIVEARVVDEYGKFTDSRKVQPAEWFSLFKNNAAFQSKSTDRIKPLLALQIPKWAKQLQIYLTRDTLSKVSNTQYVVLNLLESPLLAFILSYLIRYIADPSSDIYIFRDNENFPRYIFMAIVVALFLGLTVSAEEIFKDRKILKREKFLELSRSSYLCSKIVILTAISAIQALLFTLVGNTILGVPGMFFEFWFALFSTFILANMIGLNVSQTFNSAVTIYILIPFILIPMMALGGAMFSFDKLNRSLGSVGSVPVIAELMPSKWVYEALMVHQFKNNDLAKQLYQIEKAESVADFKKVYYIPKLQELLEEIESTINTSSDSIFRLNEERIRTIRNEINIQSSLEPELIFASSNSLNLKDFNPVLSAELREHFLKMDAYFGAMFHQASLARERYVQHYMNIDPRLFNNLRDRFTNESIREIVKNIYEKNKILTYNGRIIQQVDPIYLEPDNSSYIGIRSHFYAPRKYFMGRYYETFWFNIAVVWIFTLFFYITLYFEILQRLMDGIGRLSDKITPAYAAAFEAAKTKFAILGRYFKKKNSLEIQ
jgi:ABC transport system ATP-binding/permease protein